MIWQRSGHGAVLTQHDSDHCSGLTAVRAKSKRPAWCYAHCLLVKPAPNPYLTLTLNLPRLPELLAGAAPQASLAWQQAQSICSCTSYYKSRHKSSFCMQVVVFALGVGSTGADATQLIAAFVAICANCSSRSVQTNHVSSADQDLSKTHKGTCDAALSSGTSNVTSMSNAGTSDSISSAGTNDSSRSSSGSSSTAFSDVSCSNDIGNSGNSSISLSSGNISDQNSGRVVHSKASRQRMSPREAFFADTDR